MDLKSFRHSLPLSYPTHCPMTSLSKTLTHFVQFIASTWKRFSMPSWISNLTQLSRYGASSGVRKITTTWTSAKRKNTWANWSSSVSANMSPFRILFVKSTSNFIKIWSMFSFPTFFVPFHLRSPNRFAILPRISKIGWHQQWWDALRKLFR